MHVKQMHGNKCFSTQFSAEKVNVGSDVSESEDEESEMPQPKKRHQSSSASTGMVSCDLM